MYDNFPKDVMHEIFIRLSIKSIIKCSAVCKSWSSVIKSSAFIRTHLSHAIQPNNPRKRRDFNRSIAAFGKHDQYPMLIHPFSYNGELFSHLSYDNESNVLDVVGTCNGVVCLAFRFENGHQPVVIWNPSVRKYVSLPIPCVTSKSWIKKTSVLSRIMDGRHRVSYAFGCDSRGDDYKVLRNVSFMDKSNYYSWKTRVDVWSLARGGSWKNLSADVIPPEFMPAVDGHKHAFVNGALHWLQYRCNIKRERVIVTFNMDSELFGEIMMPKVLKDKLCFISRNGESLALYVNEAFGSPRGSSDLHLWVMKEYGVAESWTKLFTVSLRGFVREPVCIRRSGEVVLRMHDQNIPWVYRRGNPDTFSFLAFDSYVHCFMDFFVVSLVLLDQANAISY